MVRRVEEDHVAIQFRPVCHSRSSMLILYSVTMPTKLTPSLQLRSSTRPLTLIVGSETRVVWPSKHMSVGTC
jgi:hypothetical protein